jgi:hypothetical protein
MDAAPAMILQEEPQFGFLRQPWPILNVLLRQDDLRHRSADP